MPKEKQGLKEREKLQTHEPRRYKVIFHNDDFTPMEFVVRLLMTTFHKSQPEAEMLMLTVHRGGEAVVGIYSYDMAHSRARKATQLAREESHPLRITVELDDWNDNAYDELPF